MSDNVKMCSIKLEFGLGKCKMCMTIYCMLIQMHRILSCPFFPRLEDRQKKKRQQKKKRSADGKTSLQRSKTFVNLLFKKDHKEKSPSHHAGKGEGAATGQVFPFPLNTN